MSADDFDYSKDVKSNGHSDSQNSWKMMIVDDEPMVHDTTYAVFDGFIFNGRPLELISAYSKADACEKLSQHQDIAVILLDVIMESNHAGLDTVSYIRDKLKDKNMRILLRTGQSGRLSEEEIFERYDINGFLDKAELTCKMLRTCVKSALRTYQTLLALEQSNNAKSNFLSNISHELRTPLHGILSYSQMGSKRVEDLTTEKLKRYFDNIELSGQRLLSLINDLLDLTKLESGCIELELAQYDITLLINNCQQEMSAKLAERNLVIHVDKLSENLTVECDGLKITQVLANLLSNAMKFSPPDSVINFKIEQLNASELYLEVCDKGTGIPANQVEQIFDKFIQIDSAQKGVDIASSGLGLAICREIVQAHNGRIWAKPSVNESDGGTICLLLPLQHSV